MTFKLKVRNIEKIVLAAILLVFTGSVGVFASDTNYSVTSISFETYQTTDDTDTITGSQLTVSYQNQFVKHWSYLFSLSSGSASGEHKENNTTYELSASSTTLSGGLQWNYAFDLNSDNQDDLTPFIGAGLSIQRYDYDFGYSGSKVGKTSGTGYGPFGTLGLKISLSSNIIIIPGYHYRQITIKTEDGTDHSFTSSGISLAFVARF